jgi:hypothetical protein
MYEIGTLIQATQDMKDYKDRRSAEADVAEWLMVAQFPYTGEQYVRTCWQFAYKLSDKQRAACIKYCISVQDAITLCHMTDNAITAILDQIKRGELRPEYGGRQFQTYSLRRLNKTGSLRKEESPSEHDNLSAQGISRNPDVLSAKIWQNGSVVEEAVTNLLAALYSRVSYELIERCRDEALSLTGKKPKGGTNERI